MKISGRGLRPLCAGIAVCAACGVLYAWSIFVAPLEAAFGWSRPQTSFTFTLMIMFFAMGMYAGGELTGKIGPRATVLAGGVCFASGLALASCISGLTGLYVCYGALGGFGIGMANVVPVTVCLRWYPQRKGLSSGILALALALGTLVFGSLGAGKLLEQVGVFATWRILAALLFCLVAGGAFFLRFPQGGDHGAQTGSGLTLKEMLRTSAYWKLWLWMFCIQTGGLMIAGHIVPYGLEAGLSPKAAALAMAAYAVANGLGRPLFGMIHDRFGPFAGLSADALCMGAGLALLMTLPSLAGGPGLLAATVLVALAYGGTIPQLAALILFLFGSRHFGVNYGFSTSPLLAASLSGPFIGGLLRSASGSYALPLGIAVLVTTLALIPAWSLKKDFSAAG